GGRTTRVVTVANLKNFIATSREKMKAITGPLVEQFGPSLTQMQLVALEATASELGLRSARRHTIEGPSMLVSFQEIPEEEERRPSVTKPEEKESSATDEAAAPAEAPENRETSQASLIERVFEAYATGHYRGQRTFLRFSDLKDFAEDIKELMPDVHKSFHHFTGLLEFYYDDTQQLQSDMGLHGAKGLTLRYFQVFVQKVLRRLGPQIVGVLFALIDR
ncbi:unnamed protein product, partial [Durusdinium trenchii]